VLKLNMKNAIIIRMPPMIDAIESGSPVRNQSTKATRKMVRRAATDERTGDVREMRTRKEPENATLV
jgi:hypothetical protein